MKASLFAILLFLSFNTNAQIDKEVDEFTGEISAYTPLLKKASMMKFIKKGVTRYFLTLSTEGSTLTSYKTGVYVIFTDDTKWIKENEKVDYKSSRGSGWNYTCFVTLTDNDLKLFATKKIKKFKLYIHTDDITEKDATEFMENVNKIIEVK